MPKATRFKFEGGKALEAALGELGNRAAMRNTATRALKRAAEPIRAGWEAGVDVDKGELRDSIKVGKAVRAFQRSGNRGDYVSTFVGVDESVNARLHIYAGIEEFGGHGEDANPAGRRAFENEKQSSVDLIAGVLREEIDKTAARAARRAARKAAA